MNWTDHPAEFLNIFAEQPNRSDMKKLLSILVCFLSVSFAFAQTTAEKAQLERERQDIQKRDCRDPGELQ